MRDPVNHLLEQLAHLLGKDRVLVGDADLARYHQATYDTDVKVFGIVRPTSVAEVSTIARLCQQSRVPFYAVSSGRNWGYGSAMPAKPGIVIDLGGMDRIRSYHEKLGYVRVEPGVTLGQLHAFLQARGGRFWIDSAGASPACSVIGNTLERGFGHTPYANHAALACALEVVLPQGDVIETGFGAFGAVNAKNVYAPGIGPAVDGLFFQSSFGIVTAMTVWLMPAPERFCAFFIGIERPEQLPHLIDALQPLRLCGRLKSAIHIGNAYRILPSFTQRPTDRRGPLRGGELEALKRRFGVLAWHGSGGLYGSAGDIREGKRSLRRALRGVATRLLFLDDARLALARRLQPLLNRFGAAHLARQIDVMVPAYGLLKGVPSDRFLASVYWRKPELPCQTPDPDRDCCGLIWCAVLSEIDGKHADTVQRMATDCLLDAGFEPGITTTLISERCLDHVISITYDRDVAGEDEAARRAFEALLQTLLAAGYFPYRLPTFAQDVVMSQASHGYRALLAGLKATLDPERLFADGRYTPE